MDGTHGEAAMRVPTPPLPRGQAPRSDRGRGWRWRGLEADPLPPGATAPQEPAYFLLYDREKQAEDAGALGVRRAGSPEQGGGGAGRGRAPQSDQAHPGRLGSLEPLRPPLPAPTQSPDLRQAGLTFPPPASSDHLSLHHHTPVWFLPSRVILHTRLECLLCATQSARHWGHGRE